MKKLVLGILAAGTALAAAAPANAALFIGYSINGGAITQLADDTATPGSVSFAGTVAGYSFNTGALGTPATSNVYDLLTQSINVSSANNAAATLNVFITETGLPALNGAVLQSTFTSNTISNATATVSSFYGTAPYTGTLLRSAVFPSTGNFTGVNTVTGPGPSTLTTRYDIAFGARGGNFNGTANITAVPEPATWGLMMLGFGAMGFALRRRRNVETRIRFA